jgi:hypothetical protein
MQVTVNVIITVTVVVVINVSVCDIFAGPHGNW